MSNASHPRSGTLRTSLIVVAILALLPPLLDEEYLFALSLALVYAIAALGLDLFAGYGGVLSLCNFAFVAVGAYTSAVLVLDYGWSPWATLAASVAGSAVVALAVGSLIVRLRHLGAALATFSFAFVVVIFLEGDLLSKWTRSSSGIPAPLLEIGGHSLSEGYGLYYLAWAFLLITLLVTGHYVRSRAGKALRVVKRSDVVAESLGINSYLSRLSAFVFSAAAAGAAGFVYGQALVFLSPGSFDATESIHLLAMVVVGGLGSLGGPILGAVAFETIGHISDAAEGARELVFAAMLLAALVLLPGGLFGVIERAVRKLPVKALGHKTDGAPPPIVAEPLIDGEIGHAIEQWTTDRAASVPPRHDHGIDSALALEGVCVEFGGIRAVDGVSLHIPAGSIRALIGPNGAGKTTLLNTVSGLQPHTGRITMAGNRLSGLGARKIRRRGVTRTFQHPSLVPDLTVVDNVRLGAFGTTPTLPLWDLIPSPRSRAREHAATAAADAALRLVGFPPDRWSDMAADLTLAEQKLIDIARAIAGHPRLLLMDEPTAGLEHAEMEMLAIVIRRVREETGATIVIIAHHVGFVRALADEVSVLDFGRVLASGTPDEVIARPDVATVFLGEAHA